MINILFVKENIPTTNHYSENVICKYRDREEHFTYQIGHIVNLSYNGAYNSDNNFNDRDFTIIHIKHVLNIGSSNQYSKDIYITVIPYKYEDSNKKRKKSNTKPKNIEDYLD
jgi:hypothetical protein